MTVGLNETSMPRQCERKAQKWKGRAFLCCSLFASCCACYPF